MSKSSPSSSGQGPSPPPQNDMVAIDLDNGSFDGHDFELDMGTFPTEELVKTFFEAENGGNNNNASTADAKEAPAASLQGQTPETTATPGATNNKRMGKNGELRPSRRKKKNKDKPRRPLCGYNIFFQKHSKEIQPTTAFKDLGRIMGERWKSLTEEQRSVYEKEAEKDVVRFRREMDMYEKKRKERLCPSYPSSSHSSTHPSAFSQSPPPLPVPTSLDPPPGWSASTATATVCGFPPSTAASMQSSSSIFVSGTPPPPPFPNTGLHVPGQYMGTPPTTMALPHGTEISLPDSSGVSRTYRVVYACYRMTQQEANDYMARFAEITAGCNFHQQPASMPVQLPQQPQGPPTSPPPMNPGQVRHAHAHHRHPPHPASPQASHPVHSHTVRSSPTTRGPHPSFWRNH